MVTGDEGTTDFSRADFGHVEDDDSGDETDTDAGNQTACDDKTEARRSRLENASNHIDDTPHDDGWSATIPVGNVTRNQGTYGDA